MEISLAFVTNTTVEINCVFVVSRLVREIIDSRERYGQADVANEINSNCEVDISIFNLRNVDRTGHNHRIQFYFNDS